MGVIFQAQNAILCLFVTNTIFFLVYSYSSSSQQKCTVIAVPANKSVQLFQDESPDRVRHLLGTQDGVLRLLLMPGKAY